MPPARKDAGCAGGLAVPYHRAETRSSATGRCLRRTGKSTSAAGGQTRRSIGVLSQNLRAMLHARCIRAPELGVFRRCRLHPGALQSRRAAIEPLGGPDLFQKGAERLRLLPRRRRLFAALLQARRGAAIRRRSSFMPRRRSSVFVIQSPKPSGCCRQGSVRVQRRRADSRAAHSFQARRTQRRLYPPVRSSGMQTHPHTPSRLR